MFSARISSILPPLQTFTPTVPKVTVALVEEYIKPLEMVILCVIPAMSDFGNAEAMVPG